MGYSENELPLLLATNLYHYYPDLVLSYQHRLYTFAYRLTGNAQDAEDIVQEAFVGAYVSLEHYPPQRIRLLKLRSWLYRVTLNVFSHHARGFRLHLVPFNLSEEDQVLAIEDNEYERPEALFEQYERLQELERMVAALPERYRVAITCYYFEHMSYQEIADLLDQPVGTVKSTVSRGIRLLRNMLKEVEPEGGKHSHGAP
ncbi:MAG TPA: RNA polymerase sigma factor [Ktedonobacteraceae bacterium]|jgi:RNA polymerase sigma-70 factor (ECF subfamily)